MELKKEKKFAQSKAFFKIVIAFLLSKISRRKKKPLVLVGGNLGEKYEDNASVLHHYLINERPDLDVYWLYDPSTEYAKEQQIQNAVPLGSLQNYMLFFQADYTFHGHALIYDIAPYIHQYLFLNKHTTITHISHGIEGFKKILILPEDVPQMQRTNYFNCASQHEKDIKQFEWKIPPEKLLITGMPRFDRSKANSPAKKVKRILLMMTWREWLFDLTETQFMESSYFRNTVDLLRNESIQHLMREEQVEVIFALHPFMKRFEGYFKAVANLNHSIQFYNFDELSIQEEIKKADMLLTDYSSISWDFLYMNKPIIFFMFDQKEFVENRGTYMNLDEELYGYKAKNVEEVYGLLKTIVSGGATTNPWYPTANKYIAYFDQHHCQRLVDTIIGPATQIVDSKANLSPIDSEQYI